MPRPGAGGDGTGRHRAGFDAAPLPTETLEGFSTDVGDVSRIVPTMGLQYALGADRRLHAHLGHDGLSRHEHRRKAAVQAAKGLAVMAAELLTDADLRATGRADFEAAHGRQSLCLPAADIAENAADDAPKRVIGTRLVFFHLVRQNGGTCMGSTA